MIACIVILLFCAFIVARMFNSTKVWWILVFTIMSGLLVGMLSTTVAKSIKNDEPTVVSQLVTNDVANPCTQFVAEFLVTKYFATGHSEAVSNKEDALYAADVTNNHTIHNRRDPPEYNDTS